MPIGFGQFKKQALARPEVRKAYDELEKEFAHLAAPPDAFDAAISATLEEWASPEDDEAFSEL